MRGGTPKAAQQRPRDPTGFFEYIRAFARAKFQAYVDGRGRLLNATKGGSGRRGSRRHNPPGTKLVRRFVRDAAGENQSYRMDYFRRTGHEL